ncbi:MAG: trypsin-like serine protease [Polyangiaceae bacterium]|nr:trypsin-like serine protease [Polyangiaceae bacterium]
MKRSRSMSPLFGALLAVASVGSLAGCASEELVAQNESDIYGGTEEAASDAVVALRIAWPLKTETCTATLVAPNLVLTARHCVTEQLVERVVCDAKGNSANGTQLGGDIRPSSIRVYVGTNTRSQEVARGAKIFRPEGNVLCNGDIALVQLDRAVSGVDPLPLRLEGGVEPGTLLRTVGFGKNDLGVASGTKMSRRRVGVLASGGGISSSNTPLGPNEFELGLSSCNGDSGGPAISEDTGAVVGVVSRGGRCEDDFGHVYSSTAAFEPLFREAFASAGNVPNEEVATPQDDSTTSRTTTEVSDGSGCSSQGRPSSRSNFAIFAVLALVGLRRSRSRSSQ